MMGSTNLFAGLPVVDPSNLIQNTISAVQQVAAYARQVSDSIRAIQEFDKHATEFTNETLGLGSLLGDINNLSRDISDIYKAKEDMERRNTINQIMNSNQPAAAPMAPVVPVMQSAPVATNAPDPMADGILTPAEILTGGRSISSGDLANAPAASATFPAAPTTPIANAAPVMPPQPVYQPVAPQPVPAQYSQYYAQTPAQPVAPTPTTAPAPTQAPTPTQAPVPASDSARQQPQPQVAPQAGNQPAPTTPATNSSNSQKPDIIESSKVDTKSQTPTKKGDKEIYISLH